jgi:hypothetical protein
MIDIQPPLKNLSKQIIPIFALLNNKKICGIYSSAFFSFILILIRDFYLLKYTNFSEYVFSFFYLCTLASSFSINAITLNKDFAKPITSFIFFIFSIFILFLISFSRQSVADTNFLALISVIFLWIFGAMISRIIMDVNFSFFLARSRDSIGTIFLICSLLLGINVDLSIFLSGLISFLILYLYLTLKYKRNIKKEVSLFLNKKIFSFNLKGISQFIIPNLSVFLINLWALEKTSHNHVVFYGIYSEAFSRFSIYLFQILTLASVYFTFNYQASKIVKNSALTFSGISILLYFTFSGLSEFIFLPLALVFFHYYLVFNLKT